jgi:thioredoxin 1
MSVVRLSNENFEQVVLDSENPVLIDFWAEWCGPCRMQSPIIEELATELESTAVIAKLNVDENPRLAQKFDVMSIPTIVAMKSGKVVARRVGVTQKKALLDMINSVKK